MDIEKALRGKWILVVDDEEDVRQMIYELLDMCKIDTASSYEEAKALLEKNRYHAAILDIMGVRGYDLLDIATRRDIPALMLTAHALTKEHLKKSAERGAAFYAPKDEMANIALYLADVLEARAKKQNPWAKWYERLSGFCDRRFGKNWKDQDPDFWDHLIKY
ncbi:MAG: response regulator [Deltaproteobacteria bacterium CG_4_8_14_3_um_filter_51_11]|nr:response regulator [bacterium]PIP47592.1 MAG: response regulator [Deltaproteobacteria bacterium CG23_combo_of_CG06-09_8_20_14_all_51_20]PIX18581.1 MAG: response regulator [Deltaproteobacteria bacterium CG_4_8_14_3_um_filter_51_11]PJB38131.1 MAG: response regulator [Deltaproteobacteria bacterium CG_4_9_14_3_um_filter_51_14]